jgi:hypothetical protein
MFFVTDLWVQKGLLSLDSKVQHRPVEVTVLPSLIVCNTFLFSYYHCEVFLVLCLILITVITLHIAYNEVRPALNFKVVCLTRVVFDFKPLS